MNNIALRDRDLEVLRSTLGRFPFVLEARLFGSRATGHARRASDIDLAISAPDAKADQWLELTESLHETPIIYEMDVVRMDRVNNPRLIERVARDGIIIYTRQTTHG